MTLSLIFIICLGVLIVYLLFDKRFTYLLVASLLTGLKMDLRDIVDVETDYMWKNYA